MTKDVIIYHLFELRHAAHLISIARNLQWTKSPCSCCSKQYRRRAD